METLRAFMPYTLYIDPQIVLSRSEEYDPFSHIEVSEDKAVEICIIVWGLLRETLHVMVETADSALAVGECNSIHVTPL